MEHEVLAENGYAVLNHDGRILYDSGIYGPVSMRHPGIHR
jgi:hypothetical protein